MCLCVSSLVIMPEPRFDYEHPRADKAKAATRKRRFSSSGCALNSQKWTPNPILYSSQAGCHYQRIRKSLGMGTNTVNSGRSLAGGKCRLSDYLSRKRTLQASSRSRFLRPSDDGESIETSGYTFEGFLTAPLAPPAHFPFFFPSTGDNFAGRWITSLPKIVGPACGNVGFYRDAHHTLDGPRVRLPRNRLGRLTCKATSN